MEIFKLFGSILIKSDEADKSIQKTENKAVKLASALGKGITTATKWGAGDWLLRQLAPQQRRWEPCLLLMKKQKSTEKTRRN